MSAGHQLGVVRQVEALHHPGSHAAPQQLEPLVVEQCGPAEVSLGLELKRTFAKLWFVSIVS